MDKIQTQSRTAKGSEAEKRAWDFLSTHNFVELLASNFRWRRGEIDLVLWDRQRGEVVFVEVRSAQSATTAERLHYTLAGAKRRHLRQTADIFMRRPGDWNGKAYRFDVLWIYADRVEHWRNVEI